MKTILLLAFAALLCGCNVTLPKVETKFCYTDENGEVCVGSTPAGSIAFTGGYKKQDEQDK